MGDEDWPGGQGNQRQVSPDGKFVWDGHNWVPVQQHAGQQGQPGPGGPGGPGGPIRTSPDGRFWWDGTQWVPTQPPVAAPQAGSYGTFAAGSPQPEKRGIPTVLKVVIGLVVLFAVGIVGLVVLAIAVGDPNEELSCQDVAEEAVGISDDQEDQMFVLEDVRDLEIIEDNRDSYETPSSGEEVILSCEGTGVWDKIDEAPVLVQKTVDADGDEWIRYEMTD